MKQSLKILLFLCINTLSALQAQTIKGDPFTHTFSIVAVDEQSGEIGAAVQSHWFSVGSIVIWAEAGVGAVATQSLVNVSFGSRGLQLLKQGRSAPEAIDALTASDEGKNYRQVAVIQKNGRAAAFTGSQCIAEAAHHTGKNYSVQANMMLNDQVVPAMAQAFENSNGPLAERMMAALQAAQAAGGDIRGQQSAALLVVRGETTGNIWEDRLIDLRVEDHPDAVAEMARVLKVHRAYEHMNQGDLAIETGDVKKALKEYGAAAEMLPGNVEMQFWTAVSLANTGHLDKALPLFRKVFHDNENWMTLTERISKNGLLNVDRETLRQILALNPINQ